MLSFQAHEEPPFEITIVRIIIDLIRPYTIFSTVISELLIVCTRIIVEISVKMSSQLLAVAIAGISSVTRVDATKFVKSELLKDGCKNTTIGKKSFCLNAEVSSFIMLPMTPSDMLQLGGDTESLLPELDDT